MVKWSNCLLKSENKVKSENEKNKTWIKLLFVVEERGCKTGLKDCSAFVQIEEKL